MLRYRTSILRLALLALAAIAIPACDTDGPGGTGYNHALPVVGRAAVTVTTNKASLPAGGTSPATVTVTAVSSTTGLPVTDLTVVTMTTNLGAFGSVGGPNAAQILTHSGVASVAFFPGEVSGTAVIQANVLNGLGYVEIQIR
jgi:hypothetical protein